MNRLLFLVFYPMSQMEGIKSCLICLIVLHAVLSRTADATNTVISSVVNGSAFFNCSTSSDNVEWLFGSDPYERSYIYSYETVTLQYRNRFRMENYTNGFDKHFNLILQPVTKDDAGSYTCSRNEADGKAETEVLLIVSEAGPTCEEYWNAEGVIGPNSCGIEPETVQLSCSVRYIGIKAPTLTWAKVGEYIPIKPPSTECFDSGHTYTCNLTMNSDLLMDGFSYICQTTGPATRQYSCTSKAIKIIYVTADYSEINATVNDKVSCPVNSSQSCIYYWKSTISEEPVFYGQYIDPTSSGSYTCEAICPMRDKNCTVTVKKVSVSAQDDVDSQQNIAAIVVPTVLLAISLIIVCVVSRRKCMNIRREQRERTQRNTQLVIEMQPLHSGTEQAQADRTQRNHHTQQAIEMQPLHSGTEQAQAPPLIIVNVEIIVISQSDCAGNSHNIHMNSNGDIQEIGLVQAYKERIRGLTLLDNELYVTIERRNTVEVFDSKSTMIKRRLNIDGLLEPGTMASCTTYGCIYIIDKKMSRADAEIFKYCPGAKAASTWVTGSYGRLSVTKETGEVVLAAYNQQEKCMLRIYSTEGALLRTIEICKSTGMPYVWHAVELSQGVFVVSHGCCYKDSHLHRVCIVRGNGNTIEKSFGKERGPSKNQVNAPSYLAVTANGSILVTDMENHRVALLDKNLKLKKIIFEHEEHLPETMYFDKKNSQLFVGSNLKMDRGGRVLCLPFTEK